MVLNRSVVNATTAHMHRLQTCYCHALALLNIGRIDQCTSAQLTLHAGVSYPGRLRYSALLTPRAAHTTCSCRKLESCLCSLANACIKIRIAFKQHMSTPVAQSSGHKQLATCHCMQLSAGSLRQKNAQNIIFKNLMDACLGAICFYLVGYGFAYGGENANKFIGWSGFALTGEAFVDWYSWFFQYTVRNPALCCKSKLHCIEDT